jgi:hypothetical protein
MRSLIKYSAQLLFSAALATSLFAAGCAAHARVYDGYNGDYHRWDGHEVVYYNRWEHSTHRTHVDFEKRNDADRKPTGTGGQSALGQSSFCSFAESRNVWPNRLEESDT